VLPFVIRRLLLAAAVVFAFSFLSFIFFAGRFEPLKEHPVLPQYWTWLRGIPSGRSLSRGSGVVFDERLWPTLLPSLAHTLVLLALTLLLVVVFALAFATVGAVIRGSALDVLLRASAYLAWGIPAFLLALIVQQVLNAIGGSRGVGPFPIAGWPGSCPTGIGINAGTISPCPAAGGGIDYLGNVLRYVTLPALALSVSFVGLHGRQLRSLLVVALGAPFTTTARAKGLPERTVVLRHALRASLATFVAALLADFGAIFSAALAIDWVFQLNGLGSLFIEEVNPNVPTLDAYAVQLLLLVTGGLLVLFSLLSDLVVPLLDPRAGFD
jgi:peptide/nickel transport system permease protein